MNKDNYFSTKEINTFKHGKSLVLSAETFKIVIHIGMKFTKFASNVQDALKWVIDLNYQFKNLTLCAHLIIYETQSNYCPSFSPQVCLLSRNLFRILNIKFCCLMNILDASLLDWPAF